MKTTIAWLVATLPVVALAHAHLESSAPARNGVLRASPDYVTLVFSEPVELTALTLQKAGEKTRRDLAPLPKEDSVQLVVPLPKLGEGDYVLFYAAVSSDQHETKGTIPFKVSAGANSAPRQ